MPVLDSCNATTRERARLFICELPLHHDGQHRDGEHTWLDDTAVLTLRQL